MLQKGITHTHTQKGNNTYLAVWDINKILSDIISSDIIDIIIKYQIL